MNAEQPIKQNQQRSAFKMLSGYLWKDKPLLIKSVLLLLVATALDVTGPILAKVFIDDYLIPQQLDGTMLLLLLGGYLLSQAGAALLGYRQTLGFTEIALNAVQDIRERVFAHSLRLPMAYFDKAMTGQLVSRITNDTEAIKDLYVQFLSVVLGNFMLLTGILIAMALLDPQLMLAALGLIPMVFGVIYLYEKFSGAAVQKARGLRSDINGQLSESISGMSVLQATNQQQRFGDRFEDVNQHYYRARMSSIKASAALLRPAIDLLSILVLIAVVWLFGLQVVDGVAEVGVLYAFLSFLGRFTEPLAEITQRFNLYQQAMVAGERVNQLLDERAETEHHNSAQLDAGQVDVKNLHFAYQPDKPVLQGLDFSIKPGQFYAVVGHTGSGKSTLLSLLLNFYQPGNGDILLDGKPLSAFGHDALRAGVGLIPQEPFIVAGTLFDNIDMGRNLGQQAIEDAARKAHLHDMICQLPGGYQTELGERGTRLSTGQRQQLVIARALAASPKILLLDEATANVDSETEQVVQKALQELHGKITLITVAHRLSTIKQADRILVLSHGKISEQGNHSQLMALENGLYSSMYRLQRQAQRVAMTEN